MIKTSSYQPLWTSLAPWSRGHKSHVMTQISWLQTSPKLPHTGQSEGAMSSGSSRLTTLTCLVSPVELPMPKSLANPQAATFACSQATCFMLVLGRSPRKTRTSGPQHRSSFSPGPCDGTSATLACTVTPNVGMVYRWKISVEIYGIDWACMQGEENSAMWRARSLFL